MNYEISFAKTPKEEASITNCGPHLQRVATQKARSSGAREERSTFLVTGLRSCSRPGTPMAALRAPSGQSSQDSRYHVRGLG